MRVYLKSILFSLLVAVPCSMYGQGSVGIGTTMPDASALLDLVATNKGVLVPRLTSDQRTAISAPANGLLVFDSNTNSFWYFNTIWKEMIPGITYLSGAGIQISGNTINNIGDTNAADDLTTGSVAGGDVSGSFFNLQIASNAVSAAEIADGTIQAADIAAGVIPATLPPSGTAGGDLTGTYPNPTITADAVGSIEIINASVANADLAASSVNGTNIIDLSVGTIDLAENAVTQAKMADNAIGSAEIVNSAVTMPKIAQSGAIADQVIKWNGTSWAPSNDDDTNTTYTAGSGLTLSGTSFSHTAHTGDVTGTTNLTITNNAVNAAKIQDGTVGISDLAFGVAASGQVLTATGAATADWLTPSFKIMADADNDTKIQVEETSDEDIIRFDLAGQERMTLIQNSTSQPRLEIGTWSSLAVGNDALLMNDPAQGFSNTAIGNLALDANIIGDYNTGIGYSALSANTTGNSNTANGFQSLYSNTMGNYNTTNGAFALYNNIANSRSTAIGYAAMLFAYSTATGDSTYNTAVGAEALRGSTNAGGNSGKYNTALGDASLFSNTIGSRNVAAGVQALYSNSSGSGNIAIGNGTLRSNTTASGLVAIGDSSLYANTAWDNTAVGFKSLHNNTTGFYNTANGSNALYSNTDGEGNTANGHSALSVNTIGNYNTAIGYNADVSANNLTNATALGNGATVNASNKVRIGNTAVTVVESQVGSWTTSDARFKFDVSENVAGLDFIKKLRPVAYNFNTQAFDQFLMKNMPDSIRNERAKNQDNSIGTSVRQTGFLAQEVENIVSEGNFIFSGVHHPDSEDDNYSLSYEKFVVPLVKAVQEQQVMIDQLKKENEILKAQSTRVDVLEAELQQIRALLSGQKN